MKPNVIWLLAMAFAAEGCCTCPPWPEHLTNPPAGTSGSPAASASSSAASSAGTTGVAPAPASSTGYFPASAPWYVDITDAPVDVSSPQLIGAVDAAGGWGTGMMRIDFTIHVLTADASAPMRTFEKSGDFYEPDCDHAPVPVPPGGALEGETGYRCESDGDCHLIVVKRDTNTLYEMWRANIDGDRFVGGCLAVWDLGREYGLDGRGRDCTSADAAGFPIAPLLFTPEEVARGEINHAIRFILPNDRIRHRGYVVPATHATSAASNALGIPYGARLRLKKSFAMDKLPNEGARTVARALQRYGMFLADGGNIALTAQSDRGSSRKWEGLLGPRDLQAIQVTDFEVIKMGRIRTWEGNCSRTP
jgi:serine/threonine-protein kinase